VLTSSAKPAARIVRESDAGAVFRDGDVADCAAAIERLACGELRARCGANGRDAIAARFHWEIDATTMINAVERVVAGTA
jgi:glycosyltransferase involved in cell wall biosynthesis